MLWPESGHSAYSDGHREVVLGNPYSFCMLAAYLADESCLQVNPSGLVNLVYITVAYRVLTALLSQLLEAAM